MATIHNIISITRDIDPSSLIIVVDFTNDLGVRETLSYAYRADDPYGLSPLIKRWLSENTHTIADYVPPVYTIEEIRAMMPDLTARQFWMAAAMINIDKDVIIAAIKADVPDGVDRKMMIAELESGSFERTNITIVEVMGLMNIPAYQVDDLWLWAAQL